MLQAYYMYIHGFKCHEHNSLSNKLCIGEARSLLSSFVGCYCIESYLALSVLGKGLVHTSLGKCLPTAFKDAYHSRTLAAIFKKLPKRVWVTLDHETELWTLANACCLISSEIMYQPINLSIK